LNSPPTKSLRSQNKNIGVLPFSLPSRIQKFNLGENYEIKRGAIENSLGIGEHGVTIKYSIETWWEHQNPKIPTIYVFQYSSIYAMVDICFVFKL